MSTRSTKRKSPLLRCLPPHVGLACGLALTAGCGSGGQSTPSSSSARSAATSSASSVAPKAEGFDARATVGGTPIDLRYAMAFQREGQSVIHVWVSTHAHDCAEASRNGTRMATGEKYFSFAVARPLAKKDREGDWLISDTYYEASSLLSIEPRAKVVGADASKDLRITLPKVTFDDFHKKAPLEVEGTIVAKGCGSVPAPDLGVPRGTPAPLPDLTVSVDEERIELKAALLTKDKLILSTQPLSCQQSYSYADVTMLIDRAGTSAGIQGARSGDFTLSKVDPPLAIKLGDPAGGRAEVAIEGTFRHRDLAAKLSGKGKFVVCDP